MIKIVRALCVLLFLCATPAVATDNGISHPGQIPSSTLTNQQTRDDRVALGILIRDSLGAFAAAGAYNNISIVPNGGMYVSAQPTSTGPGSLYQLGPDDPLPLPQNELPQLSIDTTQIGILGLQNGPIGAIGPMTAPTSGSTVIYLVEAQAVRADGPLVSVYYQNASGGKNTESQPVNRTDTIVYQTIAGNASSTPIAPTPTAGWVGIATVTIPSGTTAISAGMIAPLPPFGGFVANGSPLTAASLTLPNIAAGCLQVLGGGAVSSLPCSSGVGSVPATFPITSSTNGGTVTIACSTCVTSVNVTQGLTSTGGTTPTLGMGLITPNGMYSNGTVAVLTQGTATSSNTSYSSYAMLFQNSYYANGTQTTRNPYLYSYFDGSRANFAFSGNDSTGLVPYVHGMFVGDGSQLTNLPNQLTHGDYCDAVNAQTCAGHKTFSNGIIAEGNGLAATGGTAELLLQDTTNTSNAPKKYLRANGSNGCFETINSAGITVIGQLCDTGDLYAAGSGSFNGALMYAANSNGVIPSTCCTVLTSNFSQGNAETNFFNTYTNANLGQSANVLAFDFHDEVPSGNSTPTQYQLAGVYRDGTIFANGMLQWGGGPNSTVTPTLNVGRYGVATWNHSGGQGETNFYDLYPATNTALYAFDFRAVLGSTDTQLARITRDGAVHASAYYNDSRRALKRDIAPLSGDPLDVVDRVDYRSWRYNARSGFPTADRHVGIVADDTPSQISGARHDRYDIGAQASYDGAATKELHAEVKRDEATIAELSARLDRLEGADVAKSLSFLGPGFR